MAWRSEHQRVLEEMLAKLPPPRAGRALLGPPLLAEIERMEAEGVLVRHGGALVFELEAAGVTAFSDCGVPWGNVTRRLEAVGWRPVRVPGTGLLNPPPQREGTD